ncbi:MAG: hypothetical protein DRJ01_10870 [Bacteroidetes bacterium]|nr:MAG: hypothetical protein DRJ01_10870 [Bacteroidota bacterium]
MKNIGCSILAGGKNSRIGGRNKALIEIDSCTILKNNTEVLRSIFDEIILVTNSPEQYSCVKNDYTIISDKIKGIGPLGGIYSALLKTKKDSIFFVPCDMPFLNTVVINKVIEEYKNSNYDAVVPRIKDNIEPLHAIYKKSIYEKLYTHITEGSNYSIRNFYKKIKVHYLDLEDNLFNNKVFTNINTHADLKTAIDLNNS